MRRRFCGTPASEATAAAGGSARAANEVAARPTLSEAMGRCWVFWGITKVARPAGDPLATLTRAWERYHERAAAVVAAIKDEDRARVRELIAEHAGAIKDLRGKVA